MKYLAVIYVVALLLTGCKLAWTEEPEPKLPPETQQGKNTFGCYVNGQLWVKKGTGSLPGLRASYGRGQLFILAYKEKDDSYVNLDFYPGYVSGLGSFEIKGYQHRLDDGMGTYSIGTQYYHTDSLHTGILTITHLDSISRIISGRFHFRARNCQAQVVEITDGRFDVKY